MEDDDDDSLMPDCTGMLRPTLIQELSKILDEYPDDGQILKELIQNAEDASASEMKILYDNRQRLLSPSNRQVSQYTKYFQSPALCVYNNEYFSKKDWEGIKQIGQSVKELDPSKVGRFGLGFKSVFHITDFPMIMSGEQMLIIDPYRDEARCCIVFDLKKLNKYKGFNMASFMEALGDLFGCGNKMIQKGCFEGTLFRFPLRQHGTVLSKAVYSDDKIKNLLSVFKQEASLSLIFLKTLEKMDLFTGWESMRQGKADFQVVIAGCDVRDVKKARKEMLSESEHLPEEPRERSFILTVECFEKGFAKTSHRWIVVNRLEGSTQASPSLIELSNTLHYLPYVGVAFPYDIVNTFLGHIFCFLPLPMQSVSMTNLPVHVHGQFALSQNRQHLKWADVYTLEEYKEKTVKWNELLISETLPKAYFTLIQFMRGLPGCSTTLIAQSLPDLRNTNDHFKSFVRHLFEKLRGFPFLFTSNKGGRWICCYEAVFPILDALDQKDEDRTIVDSLESYDVNLIRQSDYRHVFSILTNAGMNPTRLSPEYISRLLKNDSAYKTFPAKVKESLLTYILSSGNYALLDDLQLLPLANGSYTTFQRRSTVKVYLCSKDQQRLFPGMEDRIIKQLPQTTRDLILLLAKSGKYQLAEIQEDDVLSLMRQSIATQLGESHLDGASLAWPQRPQLDEKWLQAVWQFFTYPPRNIPKDLPILPQIEENGKRYLHSVKQLLILREYNHDHISPGIVRCLESMSIVTLPRLPDFVTYHPHLMKNWVERPTVDGVLRVLSAADEERIKNFNQNAKGNDREKLVSFLGSYSNLSSMSNLWNNAKKVLQRLKIFHSHDITFLSVNEENRISQNELLPVPLPFRCLTCKTVEERNLAKCLGAQQLGFVEAIETIFQILVRGSFYNESNKTNMMNYFLKNFHHFQNNERLLDFAQKISFVIDGNGQIKLPGDLFDPRNKLLVQMFNDPGKFPHSKEHRNLDTLTKLGLRSLEKLSSEEILDTALNIHGRSSNGYKDENLLPQASALIRILCKHSELLMQWCNGRYLHHHLAELQIILPSKKSTSYPEVLPWYTPDHILCTPDECALKDHIQLVGSTMPLFSDECTKELTTIFHPNGEEPPVAKVIEQLYCIIDHYKERSKPELLPLITKIYSVLNDTDLDHFYVLEMKNREVIWMGHGFCRPDEVYLDGDEDDIHLEPYLYKLPTEVDSFKEFFLMLGCMSKQCPEMLLDVQRRIQRLGFQDRPEYECQRDLRIVINILNFFKDKDFEFDIYELLMPIHTSTPTRLQLRPASECNYCNEEWLKDLTEEEGEEVFYVHQDIPVSTATRLGVKSLTDSLLEETGLLDWEQEVSLISRIKSLLKGYKDGFSVPKELIQNADDAGASKVCFLYDERQNTDCLSKLINEKMSDCQGPALWAYNDALFSENDLKNITDIEGTSKGSDPSKTGKFGVGFCSVYNLTDVPSFISGQHVVMFDPQGLYLTKDRKKGMKIDLQSMKNRALLRRMSNQFKPFNGVFNCNLNAIDERQFFYSGTLFRFPLRTFKQATSEISSTVYDKEEMQKLLKIFVQCAGNLLLFTQSVSEIELYHLPPNKTDPNDRKLIFRARRMIKDVLHNPSSTNLLENNSLSVLRQSAYNLDMIKYRGFEQRDPISFTYLLGISVDFREDKLHDQMNSSEETNWIVSWAEGSEKCCELSLNSPLNHALPLASTAALIRMNGKESMCLRLDDAPYGFYKEGHLFCTLPLPVETPFQFHISSSFAITQDRKQLSTETKEDKCHIDTSWNQSVMGDAVVHSLFNLLQGLKEFEILPGNQGHTLWPIAENDSTDDLFGFTQNEFIRILVRSSPEVIYHHKLHKWTSFDMCKILDSKLLCSSVGDLAYEQAVAYYIQNGKYVLKFPDMLCRLFESKAGNDFTSKILTTEMFYSEVFFPFLESGKLKESEMDKLLMYAVETNSEILNNMLKSYPCFPSSEGVLCKPSDLILGSSSLRRFYLPSDGKFLSPRKPYENLECEDYFKKLGMIHEILPEEWLIDRVKSVEKLLDECSYCALQRTCDLYRYLSQSAVHISKETWLELSTSCFLPVSIKPPDWNYSWKASEIAKPTKCCQYPHMFRAVGTYKLPKTFAMACPKDLFFRDCKELVGCTKLLLHKPSFPYDSQVFDHLGLQGKDKHNIPVEVVVDQLNILTSETCEKFQNNEKIKNSALLRSTLQKVMSWLEQKCFSTATDNLGSLKQFFLVLENKPILFLNDKLWRPDELSFSLPNSHKCFPHLAGIQESDSFLRNCQTLLKLLGVKEKFTSEDISQVLMRFQSQIQRDSVLDSNKLEQTCGLLGALYDSLVQENVDSGTFHALKNGEILVPDVDGYLCKTADLCINDDMRIEKSDSMRFVSDKLSHAQTSMFGIKSKIQRKVRDHYKPIPFGQREELTTRIRKILDAYPADESILKELLQNADDACASELHILTDYTTYPSESVFDGKWMELQGPALLVYNDSSFTEDDLMGIQLLGIGSKSDDPTKTGQYGVGFNAVYHLTDAPSFISKGPNIDDGGETLCILDPQCKYVKDADECHPGARYCDLDNLRKLKSDVFKPYHEEELMKDTGTIFRFPLRNSHMAENSKIGNVEVTKDIMEGILEQFRQEVFQSLFFLKHIRKITFSTMNCGNILVDYSVSVNILQEDIEKRRIFSEKRRTISDKVKNGKDISCDSAFENMTKLSITENLVSDRSTNTEDWCVFERIGFRKSVTMDTILEAYKSGNLGLLPEGGVAFPVSRRSTRPFKAFCFLPLSTETGMPMHINGHFALNYVSRRNLWEDNKESLKYIWNRNLLSAVIAPLYTSAIEYQRDLCKQNLKQDVDEKTVEIELNRYLTFFPQQQEATDKNWKYLCAEIYKHIILEEKKLFPTVKSVRIVEQTPFRRIKLSNIDWICLREESSVYGALFCLNEMESMDPTSVPTIMKEQNLNIIDFCSKILTEMNTAELDVMSLTSNALIHFLKSYKNDSADSCKITGFGLNVEKTSLQSVKRVKKILHFCMNGNSESFQKEMNGLPLCILNDGRLTEFSAESPLFFSQHCDIMHGLGYLFVHKELFYILEKLETPCLKGFGVDEFADWISFILSPERFSVTRCAVKWNLEQKDVPHGQWLKNVWKFLYECVGEIKDKKDPEARAVIDKLVGKLGNWKLLPVLIGKESYLQSIHQSEFVLDLATFSLQKNLYDAVEALNIPYLQRSVFRKWTGAYEYIDGFTLVRSLVASYNDPVMVLNCLVHHLKNRRVNICEGKCNALMEYFNDNLDAIRKQLPNSASLLRALPFYVTVSGENMCLQNPQVNVIILPEGMVMEGIEKWAENSQVVLLKENKRIDRLHEFLRFSSCSILSVYTNHIIPFFQFVPDDSILTHLQFIRDNLLKCQLQSSFDKEQELLISALKGCDFVFLNEQRKQAKDFYSPHNDLFLEMLQPDCFPPEPLNDCSWKTFMELSGMKQDVESDMIIRFAEEIANEGRSSLSEETCKKSKVLLRHLNQCKKEELQKGLVRIKNIPFIVPFKLSESSHLLAVHPQYRGGNLVSFENAVIEEYKELVWTSSHILPKHAYSNNEREGLIHAEVDWLTLKPQAIKVVRNLQNISDATKQNLANSSDVLLSGVDFKSIERLFKCHYVYLLRYCLQEEVIRDLEEKPIVFLENERNCVMCRQIVYNLEEERAIKPYLFSAPLDYGQYNLLFEKLGACRKVTASHYAQVLCNLYLDTLDENGKADVLDPNERRKFLHQAIYHLFTTPLLSEIHVSRLFLPDREYVLQDSNRLIASDNSEFEERVKEMEGEGFFLGFHALNQRLAMDEVTLLKQLPKKFQPKILTEIVDERIVSPQVISQGRNIEMLSQFLKCDEFVEGVLRLILDEGKKCRIMSTTGCLQSSLNEKEQSLLRRRLNDIHIQQVTMLETVLVKKSDGLDIEGSTMRKISVAEKKLTETGSDSWILYCVDNQQELSDWLEDILDDFSIILSNISNQELRENQKHIPRILRCMQDPSEIEGILDKKKIARITLAEPTTEMFPPPGTFVPKCLHHRLDNRFSEFEEEEYVALMLYEEEVENGELVNDPVFIYAVIKRCLGKPQNVPSLISEIAPMQKLYLLNIGDKNNVEYPAFKIFKFHRRKGPRSREVQPAVNLNTCSRLLDDILIEVHQQFTAIMALDGESERRILLRRLRARHHPDQNYGNEEEATRVFQYLENLIRQNRTIRMNNIPTAYNPPPRDYSHPRYSSHQTSCNSERRERLSVPQVARKWLAQAKQDVAAAESFIQHAHEIDGFNWICYICHQAIEKAMKAMWYNLDANNVTQSHDLENIAHGLPVEELSVIARCMVSIVGRHTRMRYPDVHPDHNLPSSSYDASMANQCLVNAQKAIDLTSDSVL